MEKRDILIVIGALLLLVLVAIYLAWTLDYLIKYYIDYGKDN